MTHRRAALPAPFHWRRGLLVGSARMARAARSCSSRRRWAPAGCSNRYSQYVEYAHVCVCAVLQPRGMALEDTVVVALKSCWSASCA